jgi:hypothetical protein
MTTLARQPCPCCTAGFTYALGTSAGKAFPGISSSCPPPGTPSTHSKTPPCCSPWPSTADTAVGDRPRPQATSNPNHESGYWPPLSTVQQCRAPGSPRVIHTKPGRREAPNFAQSHPQIARSGQGVHRPVSQTMPTKYAQPRTSAVTATAQFIVRSRPGPTAQFGP